MKVVDVASRELISRENVFQHMCSLLVSCFCFVELRFASVFDKCLMLVGMVSAIVAAICVPLVIILFGTMMMEFINFQTITETEKRRHVNEDARLSREELVGMAWIPGGFRTLTNTSIVHLSDTTRIYAISVAVVGTIQWVCGAILIYTLNHTAERFALKIRIQYVKAILSNDIGWFDQQNNEQLCTNTSVLINDIQDGLGEKLGLVVYSMCVAMVCFMFSMIRGWKLSLILASTFPLIGMAVFMWRRLTNWFHKKQNLALLEAEACVVDSMKNIRHVIVYEGQNVETQRFNKLLRKSQDYMIWHGSLHGVFLAILWMLMYCTYAVAYYIGASSVLNPEGGASSYTPPNLIVILFCTQIGILHIINMPVLWKTMIKARRAAAIVSSTIDSSRKNLSTTTISTLVMADDTGGFISFQNVQFCYPRHPTKRVLNGISFNVNVNETVAFVGVSGSGKTTIMRLLFRFYEPQRGQILIDNTKIHTIGFSWLRKRIAIIEQDPVLFGTTIFDALKHNLQVSAKEIQEAAKAAGCHEQVARLSMGYSSSLSRELPVQLKQRLVIARALLRSPHILILDHALTYFSPNDSKILIENIKKFGKHKTILIVTSKLDTMARADKVLHISEGRVIEEGTLVQLMKSKGDLYRIIKRSLYIPQHGNSDVIDELLPIPDSSTAKACDLSMFNRIKHEKEIMYTHPELVSICHYPALIWQKDVPVDFEGFDATDQSLYTWLTVLRLSKPEWLYLLVALIAATITGFSVPTYAVIFGECLSLLGTHAKDEDIEKKITFFTYLFLVAGCITAASKVVQWYMISLAQAKMTKRLRRMVFQAMLSQELAWYDDEENQLDKLLKLIRIDAKNAPVASGPLLATLTQALATLVTCGIICVMHHWKIGMTFLVFAPGLLYAVVFYNYVTTQHVFSEGLSLNKAKHIITEAVVNIRSVASLGLENMFVRQYAAEVTRAYSVVKRNIYKRSILFGMCLAIPCYIYALSIAFGGHLLAEGEIKFEGVFKVAETLILGTIMVEHLITFSVDTIQARISASRLLKLINRTPMVTSSITEYQAKWKVNGDIKFRLVGFSHRKRVGLPELRNFSLSLRPGQTVSLVGVLGGGKSVPIQLLLRFYNTTAGVIMLDSWEITNINILIVRGQMGLVDGDPIFFRRTVVENIAYGDVTRRVNMDEIISAAKEANVHNFIASLPDGYKTVLDDDITLTTSQKLRLSLARALYRDPPILLIENIQEAESEEAEMVLEAVLKKAIYGRTCILVSRQIKSVVQVTDNICMVSEGEIKEQGTHKKLMKERGLYYRLYCREELLNRKTESSLIHTRIVKDAQNIVDNIDPQSARPSWSNSFFDPESSRTTRSNSTDPQSTGTSRANSIDPQPPRARRSDNNDTQSGETSSSGSNDHRDPGASGSGSNDPRDPGASSSGGNDHRYAGASSSVSSGHHSSGTSRSDSNDPESTKTSSSDSNDHQSEGTSRSGSHDSQSAGSRK